MTDQKLQASLVLVGAACIYLVKVKVGVDSVCIFLGYVQHSKRAGCSKIGWALSGMSEASLKCLDMHRSGHSPGVGGVLSKIQSPRFIGRKPLGKWGSSHKILQTALLLWQGTMVDVFSDILWSTYWLPQLTWLSMCQDCRWKLIRF